MIPQTRLPEGDEWPDGLPFLEARQPEGNLWRDDPPFSRRDGWRPLRLVLDDDSLTEEDISTVLAFSDYEEVEVWHTDPNVLPHLELQEPSQDYLPIRKIGEPEASFSSFGVHLAQHLADRARRLARETGCSEEIVWRLLVLSAAVDQKQVDGFVTRRRLLLDRRSPGEDAAVTVEEALALVGLALRLRGNTAIGSDLHIRLGESDFHFLLARDLLRDGWRLFSGCVAHSSAVGDDTALHLGSAAAVGRLQRVLQIRDRLHAQAKQTVAGTDELIFQFEAWLLFLQAAFDAAARVAHLVYISNKYEDAGWLRDDWKKKLARQAPTLAGLVENETRGAAVIRLVSTLRNTIHGEQLRSFGTAEIAHPVQLEERDAEKLAGQIKLLDEEPQAWGLTIERPWPYLVADRYTEALLPHAVETLNELFSETQVERLKGVDPQKLRGPPPDTLSPDPLRDFFSYEIRQRVRQLAGI